MKRHEWRVPLCFLFALVHRFCGQNKGFFLLYRQRRYVSQKYVNKDSRTFYDSIITYHMLLCNDFIYCHGILFLMPRKSTLNLPPIDTSDEDIGKQLSNIRKKAGLTQNQLAEKMGLTQSLVSSYERGVLRLNAEMILRFSGALEVSADEIILKKANQLESNQIRLRYIKRIKRLESLPENKQKSILHTLDSLIRDAEKNDSPS